MALKLTNALSNFDLAEFVDLDCGTFDIKIQQAAIHNEKFRAAIAKRALQAKKTSLVTNGTSLTGSFDQDVELFIEHVLISWGERPLLDDDGKEVPFTADNLREIFTSSREGKILFGKIQTAAVSDEVFAITDEDAKNF